MLKRAKAGEDFAALAKENSQDGSASEGGDLGFFPRGRMVPAVRSGGLRAEARRDQRGRHHEFGYHIIKLTEKKAGSTVPFDQVKPQVVEYLTNQKKQQRVDSFVNEAKKRAKIEVLV